jgi:hypothetical protein
MKDKNIDPIFNVEEFKHKIAHSINILIAYEEDQTALRNVMRITDIIMVNLLNAGALNQDPNQNIYQINMLNDFALISGIRGARFQKQIAAEYLARHQDEITLYEEMQAPQTSDFSKKIFSFFGYIAKILAISCSYSSSIHPMAGEAYILRPHYDSNNDDI